MHATRLNVLLLVIAFLAPATAMVAQDQPAKAKPEDTEVWKPEPPVVTPGPAVSQLPPSDAIVLFDGKNLDEWVTTQNKAPATWTVEDGTMKVNKRGGNIETKHRFK